jgi:hypothetical protein
MSRGAHDDRGAWGCEREQGAGSTGAAGGGDRRESLADAGQNVVSDGFIANIGPAAVARQSGVDRRIGAGRRRAGVWYWFGMAEVAT